MRYKKTSHSMAAYALSVLPTFEMNNVVTLQATLVPRLDKNLSFI